MTREIATHESPAWGTVADFLIFADLSPTEMDGCWEQLWAKRLSDNTFVLCCIPFLTYGMSLGDTIQTEPRTGRTYVVAKVVARTGRRVLRLWFGNAQPESRTVAIKYLQASSAFCEWSSTNMLAIDLPPGALPADAETMLSEVAELGVEVEWGD